MKKPNLLRAILVLLFVSITCYFMTRSVFLAFAHVSPVNRAFAVCFLLAEIFVMFHAFGYFLNIYNQSRHAAAAQPPPPLSQYPPVAVLVPARHEPKEILEQNVLCFCNLDYPSKSIYILDDSSIESYRQEAEQVAAKYGVRLFRREERHGAKAGIVNDCVKDLTEKYVAIFDVDQNPLPGFLFQTIPFLEADPKLAFIQTPQFYSNLESSRVAFAADMQQSVFYEYICEGKSTNQAMIFCGTNGVLRREALLDVGGLDESTVTEDFATSVKLHARGWKSLYYNHVSTFGMGPEDLGSYFKQQNRWAMGNVGVLRKICLRLLSSPRELKPLQWLEYLITGSYFLIGWAYLFLIFCPVCYLFFSIPTFFLNPVVYALSFTPYFVLSIAVFYTTMLSRGYKVGQVLQGQLLSFVSLPVYMRASLFGLIGVRGTFEVTAKGGGRRVPLVRLWPQIGVWAVCIAAIAWGCNRLVYEPTPAIAVNVFWTIYHALLMSSIFYFNDAG